MKLGMRLPGILRQLLDLWQPSESIVLGGAAIGVGLASGIGVWLFKGLIVVTHDFVFTQVGVNLGQVNHWLIAVIPMVGGLVVGVILPIFIGSERHQRRSWSYRSGGTRRRPFTLPQDADKDGCFSVLD